MTVVDVLHAIAAVLLGAAAVLILFRILKGPSILDRMVASDVLVSSVVLVLGVEMVVNHHVRTLPIVLALSGTAVLGSIAVARYVSKHDRVEVVDASGAEAAGAGDARIDELERRAEGRAER